ncbi:MAG TPA: hypothetical protein VNN10_05180 [Dehalococcoidia bacterium]|nr:hypothetical protein [Dehalococcoidia bacterium]
MAHIAGLDEAEVATYTYEAHPSDFPGARADLLIYGPDGRLRFRGRDFYGGLVAIWTA